MQNHIVANSNVYGNYHFLYVPKFLLIYIVNISYFLSSIFMSDSVYVVEQDGKR